MRWKKSGEWARVCVCACVGGGLNNLLIVWLGIVIHYDLHVNVTGPNCQAMSAKRIANQGGH